MLEIFRENQ